MREYISVLGTISSSIYDMQKLRKLLFYVFTGLYLFICPLVILYSIGYIYTPGSGKKIKGVGLIYVNTTPEGAYVYLGKSRFSRLTPATIGNLLPGQYSLSLVLKDCVPWIRSVAVKAEKATVLDKIILLPDKWQFKTVAEIKTTRFIPVPGGNTLLVPDPASISGVRLYDYRDSSESTLLPEVSIPRDSRIMSYITADKSPVVLLKVLSRGRKRYLWVDTSVGEKAVKDITYLMPERPYAIRFLPGKEDTLFVYACGNVDRIDLAADTVRKEYFRNVKGFGLYDDRIYILDKDNILKRFDLKGKNKEILLDDPELGKRLFGDDSRLDIRCLPGNLIFFLDDRGQLITNCLPYVLSEKGIRGFEAYAPRKRIVIWKSDRIGILDLRIKNDDNEVFEKAPSVKWIYLKGGDIKQCYWAYRGSHVIFQDRNDIFMVSAEDYGEGKADRLFKVKNGSRVFYSENTGKAYFVDPGSGNIVSADILRNKGIISQAIVDAEKNIDREKDDK